MKRSETLTAIIGPDSLMRDGLARILSDCGFRIALAASSFDAMEGSAQPATAPDLLLYYFDCANTDWTPRIGEIRKARAAFPLSRIALLVDDGGAESMSQLLNSGANGYFHRPADAEVLIKSLELLMLGADVLLSQQLSELLTQTYDKISASSSRSTPAALCDQSEELDEVVRVAKALSPSEKRVLLSIQKGHTNKTIARELGIAESTVKVHVKTILRKVGVTNRTKAAIWAFANRRHLKVGPEQLPCSNKIQRPQPEFATVNGSPSVMQ